MVLARSFEESGVRDHSTSPDHTAKRSLNQRILPSSGEPKIRYCGSTPCPRAHFPGGPAHVSREPAERLRNTYIVTPALQRNSLGVKFALIVHDKLLAGLSQHHTRLTPTEVVHAPEGVEREEEREGRNGENVEQHPANHIPLPTHDKHECLNTIDSRNHDQRQRWDGFALTRDQVNEVDDLITVKIDI